MNEIIYSGRLCPRVIHQSVSKVEKDAHYNKYTVTENEYKECGTWCPFCSCIHRPEQIIKRNNQPDHTIKASNEFTITCGFQRVTFYSEL